MSTTTRLAALCLCAPLLLGGCAGDDAGDSSSAGKPASASSSEPAGESPSEEATDQVTEDAKPKGDLVGTGYAFDLPKGWVDSTKQSRQLQRTIDVAAAETTPADGFADNLNVGWSNVGAATLDQLEATVPSELKKLVAKGDLEILPRTDIGGVEAIHHRGPAALGTTKYFLEQYAAITDDGDLAIVTFSFARSVPEKERDQVIATVLDSWTWKAKS